MTQNDRIRALIEKYKSWSTLHSDMIIPDLRALLTDEEPEHTDHSFSPLWMCSYPGCGVTKSHLDKLGIEVEKTLALTNEEPEDNKVISACQRIIDYQDRLSKGCTCSNEDEHKRLGCVSLASFLNEECKNWKYGYMSNKPKPAKIDLLTFYKESDAERMYDSVVEDVTNRKMNEIINTFNSMNGYDE